MKLYLNNVGIIKDSEVKLEGLTVITGKNNSGKTTVGKTVYSLISAGSNLSDAFDETRKKYICSQLLNIEQLTQIRRIIRMWHMSPKESDVVKKTLWTLAFHRFTRLNIEELSEYLIILKDVLNNLTPEQYKNLYLEIHKEDPTQTSGYIEAIFDNFYEWQKKALDICDLTLDITRDDDAYINFIKARTIAYLNHEFNKQIRPVKFKNTVANISLDCQNKTVVDIRIRGSNSATFSKTSSFVYPYNRCVFIDNPFVIDKLSEFNRDTDGLSLSYDERTADTIITSDDIEDHNVTLIKLLLKAEKKNYFDDVEIQTKYESVFKQINSIVPGEFVRGTNGFFYVSDGARLSVNNLAAGSKMFFIIKKLIMNGLLDDGTVLVLDEPESHLHPEWINKIAELLVVLVKNIKVNILLTTHSPNLLLALSVYSKEYGVFDKTSLYLAEMGKDGKSYMKEITENPNEGYAHLSIPLVEMNIKSKTLTNEDNQK